MKKMRNIFTILFAVFALCVVIKVTPEEVKAASVTKLSPNKLYTTADFTGDGKRDKFKYIRAYVGGEQYAKVYLNGKYNCSFRLIRGGVLYRCASSRKNIFVIATMAQSSGNTCEAYRYSSGKFRTVYKWSAFEKGKISYLTPYKMTSDALYMITDTGKSIGGTFELSFSRGASFRTKYNVKDGKLSWATRVGAPVGTKIYTANNSFKTSTSITKLNSKGPAVKKGQKVTLERAYFHKTTGLWYRIIVNGKYGWIPDSSRYGLR